MARSASPRPAATELERPRLELSGPALLGALERLAAACEESGGVEAYVQALNVRSQAFQQIFERAGAEGPDAATFAKLVSFMPTVRRRVGAYLEAENFPTFRRQVMELISARHDPLAVDTRVSTFCLCFPQDKRHRWVRDLAAELLHALDPERYPLMCRWVWDARANTGVLREIWHGDVDRVTIQAPDSYGAFVMLREELSGFLATNGVYNDVLAYVDLLLAQIYAEYIAAQGGSYLRADFSSAEDPIHHVRRLLGLDGVKTKRAPRTDHDDAPRLAAPGGEG